MARIADMVRHLSPSEKAYFFLSILIAATVFVTLILIWSQQNQITQDAKRSISRYNAIQGQRFNSVIKSCNKQNERHITAVKNLQIILAGISKPTKVNNKAAVVLVNSLLPIRNCVEVANQYVQSRQGDNR